MPPTKNTASEPLDAGTRRRAQTIISRFGLYEAADRLQVPATTLACGAAGARLRRGTRAVILRAIDDFDRGPPTDGPGRPEVDNGRAGTFSGGENGERD